MAKTSLLRETHDAVIKLQTVLLGTDGDPGLVGEIAILRKEHSARLTTCPVGRAIEAHEIAHHKTPRIKGIERRDIVRTVVIVLALLISAGSLVTTLAVTL